MKVLAKLKTLGKVKLAIISVLTLAVLGLGIYLLVDKFGGGSTAPPDDNLVGGYKIQISEHCQLTNCEVTTDTGNEGLYQVTSADQVTFLQFLLDNGDPATMAYDPTNTDTYQSRTFRLGTSYPFFQSSGPSNVNSFPSPEELVFSVENFDAGEAGKTMVNMIRPTGTTKRNPGAVGGYQAVAMTVQGAGTIGTDNVSVPGATLESDEEYVWFISRSLIRPGQTCQDLQSACAAATPAP